MYTLQVTGGVRALAPPLFQLTHLTALYLNDNSLQRLPTEICQLVNLLNLDLGKLFHLQMLGLQGNPLSKEMLSIYNDNNGTAKLLSYMLDNLQVPTYLIILTLRIPYLSDSQNSQTE
ncbi:CCR4-NOT transcription complex subunit [Operophtera brumata]|uniref:CCR4-NOT transcription complex subunit n=1 Tax=Operophtera brumata TaxID=104452 RepID=A0A0L7LUL7_OPEBR|nr:CCR4-NOT transcription complex subunit [Operophtera brumata]